MNNKVNHLYWPLSRLGEGIEELARRSHLISGIREHSPLPTLEVENSEDLSRWIEWASDQLSIEAEPIETTLPDFETLLKKIAPAILTIRHDGDIQFLFLLKCKFGRMHLIGSDLDVYRCSLTAIRTLLCAPYEAPLSDEIDRLLQLAEVPKSRWLQAKSLMLKDRLTTQQIRGLWMLRIPPTAGFWQQLKQEHLPTRVILIVLIFILIYGLEIVGWGLIGHAALNGRLDFGWFAAWILLVLSLIPLHLFGSWLDASFALDLGRILKKRLLAGALRLDIEMVKHQGAGQLLGRVMESQALESLALNGGFSVVIAVIEIAFAGWVLAIGAGGQLHLLLLIGWLILTIVLIWRYFKYLRKWTLKRIDMTHELVERMVGHRTLLAQESATRREMEEDQSMQAYLNISKESDNSIAPIIGGLARGWIIISLLGLAPAFITGAGNSTGLAISLGGILLANRALSGISSGLTSLARACIAWTQVSPLFYSADKEPDKEPFLSSVRINGASSKDISNKLIDASNIVFRYRPKGDPILHNTALTIYKGERILLEGPSGGGKSTLASLLVGLRKPESGLLLLNGLDSYTLGESWHRLATEAPQFHENHMLTGTLAFNLLMGRNWPASEAELEEAKALCKDLGLAPLLERMPSGIMQMVGETGWQLSHGERSRIFLARALLQKTQLTILDESFAALDPESLKQCLKCAFKRTQTLLVIAHP